MELFLSVIKLSAYSEIAVFIWFEFRFLFSSFTSKRARGSVLPRFTDEFVICHDSMIDLTLCYCRVFAGETQEGVW